MVDEDSHSSDLSRQLSVLGEEGHSTILATLVTLQNCTEMLRNLTFVVQFHILASHQKKFLLFRAIFEQLLLQNATFDCFLSNFLATSGKP